MNTLEAVFWDFDGVVLDSVHVKTRAFGKMFEPYGTDIKNAVIEYHLTHGGVSRYEKFKYYYNELLNRLISDTELVQLGDQFSDLVLHEVLAAPFIPGALETLKLLSERNIPSFVVSGTPQEEVRHIVSKRNLTPFFTEVFGSPESKTQIIRHLIATYGYTRNKCLMLGDAMTDYDAAINNSINFIGIIPPNGNSIFPANTIINTIVDISQFMGMP